MQRRCRRLAFIVSISLLRAILNACQSQIHRIDDDDDDDDDDSDISLLNASVAKKEKERKIHQQTNLTR